MNNAETQESIGQNQKQRLTKKKHKKTENINDEQHGEPSEPKGKHFLFFIRRPFCHEYSQSR